MSMVPEKQMDPAFRALFAQHGPSQEFLDALYKYVQGRDRVPDVALLSRPIENFHRTRDQLYEFMAVDVMENGIARWSDAEAVLGIPWPTQIRLLFHGQASSPLFAWNELQQDDFEQDVRLGLGAKRLAREHGLPISQARKLLAVFRGLAGDTSRNGVDDV
jgi:hypothetical protein